MSARPHELALHLRRALPAPRPRVFRALTEPDELARWWGPHGFTTASVEIDLRVGGVYRFAMQPPEGAPFHLTGQFREIDPPARLVYTFLWEEPDPDDRETVVTVSLGGLGGSTELLVEQGPFATQARHALHDAGWSDALERLAEALSE